MARYVMPYIQRRGDVYYFRASVPTRLREAFGKREITYSLRTKARVKAQRLSREFITMCEELFVSLDGMSVKPTRADIERVLRGYFDELLREKTNGIRFAPDEDMYEQVWGAREDLAELHEARFSPEAQSEQKAVAKVIENNGWDREFVTQEMRQMMVDGIREAAVEVQRIYLAKLEGKTGDVLLPSGRFKNEQVAGMAVSDNSFIDAAGIPTLQEFIVTYCDRQVDDGWWDEKTRRNHEHDLELFAEYVGADKKLSAISSQEIRAYESILRKKPKLFGRSARFRNMSLAKAAAKARPNEYITPQTANKHYENIRQIFDFAVDSNILKVNPVPSKLRKRVKEEKNTRAPYTSQQLEIMFGSQIYNRAKFFKKSCNWWLPLLGLFSGCRSAEISMLRTKDIKRDEDTGVYYMDIVPHKSRRLKNAASERQVPIHPFLIEQGFLEYVEHTRRKRSKMLFPDIQNAQDPADAAGKRFRNMRDKLNLKDKNGRMLDFHSFRGNFTDAMREAGIPEDIRYAIAGRAIIGSESGYGEGFSIGLKYEHISKISYPVDWDLLLKSR